MLSFSRWRPRHLLLSWIGYWILLVAVTLGPAVLAALPVIRDDSGHGSINASFSNLVFSLTITNGPTTVWQGTANLLTIALCVAGPPLLLWILWLNQRARHRDPVRRAAPTR
jgi:hypothetical protein